MCASYILVLGPKSGFNAILQHCIYFSALPHAMNNKQRSVLKIKWHYPSKKNDTIHLVGPEHHSNNSKKGKYTNK